MIYRLLAGLAGKTSVFYMFLHTVSSFIVVSHAICSTGRLLARLGAKTSVYYALGPLTYYKYTYIVVCPKLPSRCVRDISCSVLGHFNSKDSLFTRLLASLGAKT